MRNGVKNTTNANAAPAAMSMAITVDHRPGTPTAPRRLSATLSRPTARLPLTNTASPARNIGTNRATCFDRVGRGVRVGSAALPRCAIAAPPAPTPITRSIPSSAAALSHGAVRLVVVRAELAHVAEHGDTPSADGQLEMRERHQGGFHRSGIGVVRVVEHCHAGIGLEQLHTPTSRTRGRRARARSPRAGCRRRDGRRRQPCAALSTWCAPVQRHSEAFAPRARRKAGAGRRPSMFVTR